VRFDCESPPLEPADGEVEVSVRVIGWPGFDPPGANGRR